jgi:c-di-GMP-binding flagellar brake protein YcgR
MENRRQDFRHAFPPPERRRVHLTAATGTATGEILDLSLGGMRVRLEPAGALKPRQRYRVQLSLTADEALALDAEVVHGRNDPENGCGLHFLPLVDLRASDARERRLWKFLLDEQLRQRRIRLGPRRPRDDEDEPEA